MYAIESLFTAYSDAVYYKDLDAFTAIFDDNIHVFDMWAWTFDGLESWSEMATNWFGSLGEEKCVVTFDDIRIEDGEDLAAATAIARFAAVSPSGETLRHLFNRFTWVARKNEDGVWKIVHEHTSGPVNHKTLQVQLQR
jgi:ketosteroid isomerase-like protein